MRYDLVLLPARPTDEIAHTLCARLDPTVLTWNGEPFQASDSLTVPIEVPDL